jgi:hypothetical protein
MFVSVNGSYTTPILCMLHPMVVISPIPEIFAFHLLHIQEVFGLCRTL